ncbi:MAG TPA: YdeI/OmpD-associated family protein [Longimicrobiaceae bacterium]|nr:YdeI/OmpD-associated family protein [Longimicrobiaceae bacterium]
MEITSTLYVSDREAWRAWLQEHYRTDPEVWLVYPRKHTGRPRIPYNDAVEEALCFGWIDSTRKTLDVDHTAQRFSPRRPGSGYSQPNKERLRRLIAQGKVAPDVLEKLRDVDLESFEIAPDILRALQANEAAWRNFQGFSGPYQRIRIAFVDDARDRPEEFDKRLRHFLRMTEQNKRFGYGIESFY